jgi:hypothetical protein
MESHFSGEQCIFRVFLRVSILKVADLRGISGRFGGLPDWHGGRNFRMQWGVRALPGFFTAARFRMTHFVQSPHLVEMWGTRLPSE